MITRLTLTDWRAYDHLTLDLDKGTTFIVAPNGVGKTSIVLGLAWALFGDLSGVTGATCVRAGAQATKAEVELGLGDGRHATISRTQGLKGREHVTYLIDGHKITTTEGTAILEHDFGVTLETAARLCTIMAADSNRSVTLDLRDHLYRAFGVADLVQAIEDATVQLKQAQLERVRQIAEIKNELDDRSQIENQLVELDEADQTLAVERRGAEESVANHDAKRREDQAWLDHDRDLAQRKTALEQLLVRAAELGLSDGSEIKDLDRVAHAMERDARRAEAEHATASGSAAAARIALELLDGVHAEAQCPTCLRSFDGGDLDEARSLHGDHETEALEQLEAIEAGLRATRHRLRDVEALRMRLHALQPLPEPPSVQRPLFEEAPADLEHALRIFETAAVERGAISARRTALLDALADHEEMKIKQTKLEATYRREALAEAVVGSLTETAERITQDRINPLVDQVRWRWKLLFGDEGLELRPDGSIVRVVGDRELDWESLSGGERIWARLVTHLLVLAASTSLPFAWFDEPLEHLDPRSRRAVAASLATASSAGGPKQLIVTTYEHGIAQQLATDTDQVTIRYVRAAELPGL